MPPDAVTVCELNAGVVHVPFLKKLYVAVPPAVDAAPVRVAVSYTEVPSATMAFNAITPPPAALCRVVEMVGVKKIADVARARSWLPVEAPSSEASDMWNGEPLMKLAELPTP